MTINSCNCFSLIKCSQSYNAESMGGGFKSPPKAKGAFVGGRQTGPVLHDIFDSEELEIESDYRRLKKTIDTICLCRKLEL